MTNHILRAAAVSLTRAALSVLVAGGCAGDDDPPRSAEVLVSGAPLVGSTNGMAFDARDRLHVANAAAQTITILDPDTGAVLDRLDARHGVFAADDVAFAPDGTLFWTEIMLGEVRGLTPSGEQLVVADGLPFVNPITVSDDGRLFVGQCFGPASNGVFELDPQGNAAPRQILGEIAGCASNGMDWFDGALYTPRWFEGRVLRVDPDTGATADVTTDWLVPTAVKFDLQGRLHAISQATGEVVRIDLETGARTTLAQLPLGLDNLAFDSSDRLFVSSTTDASIVEVLADGAVRTVVPGGLNSALGLAILGDTLYVGEGLSMRSFDKDDGSPVGVVRTVFGVDSFVSASGTVERYGDDLLLLDPFLGAARVFDPDTETVEELDPFAAPVDAEPFLTGVAVAEVGSASVVLATGPSLAERQTLADGFAIPTGLAADGDDLYVSDTAQGAVFLIVRNGEPLPAPERVSEHTFDRPEGIAIRGGRLVVVEGSGRVVELDLASGEVTILAEGLAFLSSSPGLLPFQFFNDVEIDDEGALYVNGVNTIYKL